MLGFQTDRILRAPINITQTASVLEAISIPEEQDINPEPGPDVGQLFIIGFDGKEVTIEIDSMMRKIKPGGIILTEQNIESPQQVKDLIAGLQKISLQETGLPLLVTVDQEGTPISRVDFIIEKTGQAEISDPEEAYYVGLWRGKELKTLGINLNLAPVLDIAFPKDFIFPRTFQKNTLETGLLARALVRGQEQAGILTAIKHFPGYGRIVFNPEEKLAMLDRLPETSQFEQAAEEDPEFVMCSNAIYQEMDLNLPFCFSPKSIQMLKEKLGEDILIMSDDLSQNSLLDKFSIEEVITLPISAGVDILILSGWRAPVEPFVSALQKAVENGQISEARIKESISKILKLKEAYVEHYNSNIE